MLKSYDNYSDDGDDDALHHRCHKLLCTKLFMTIKIFTH